MRRTRFDGALDVDHRGGGGVEVGINAGGEGGGHRRAEGARLELARQVDGAAEDVGVDLEPEDRAGPASAEEDARHVEPVSRRVLENMPRAARGRLVEGAEDVARPVRQREPGDGATRMR